MSRLLLIATVGSLAAAIAFVAFVVTHPQWLFDLVVWALIYPLTSLVHDVPLYVPILASAIAVAGWRLWRRRARMSTGDR